MSVRILNNIVIDSVFVCYCKIKTNSTLAEFDPYAVTGIVKKLFKNNIINKRGPSNAVSDNNILDLVIFKQDLLNALLNNEVFPLESIPSGSELSIETILYNTIIDFRNGDKTSFEMRLETVTNEDNYITPRLRVRLNRNNNIEETFIPLLEAY